MDIKAMLNSIVPLQRRSTEKVDKSLKMDATADRDANGQQPRGEQGERQEPLTDEQYDKCIQILQSLPAVRDHGLTVEVIEKDGRKFALLKEQNGQILRRIPEYELASLRTSDQKDSKKGQLLRKSA